MKQRQLLFSSLVLLIFVAFTLVVKQHVFDAFDLATTIRLQRHISQSLYTYFSFFSLVGAAEIITLFLLPIVLWYRRRSLTIFFAYGFGLAIEIMGKTFLNHAGPPHLYFKYDLGFKFPSAYVETFHSYPSGHAFRTVFIVTCWVLILYQTKKLNSTKTLLAILAITFCGVMLVSRVALGEHWTTDVIGGGLLGVSLAAGSSAITPLVSRKRQRINKLTR